MVQFFKGIINIAKIKLALSVTFLFAIIFGAFYYNNFEISKTANYCKENIILSFLISFILFIINGWFFKSLYDRYESHSNIENYKKGIKIPDWL